MEIELKNIQSILHAKYDLPDNGVVQIIGENSNGKSILTKAILFVANTLIRDKEERDEIITEGVDIGVITMKRKNMILKVTISRDSTNCRYEFTSSKGNTITRSIREGGLNILAQEFGWISFDGNICLQIFETFGIMPFVNNKKSSDYEIFDYIITDRVASNFVTAYAEITHPAFKETLKQLNKNIQSADNLLKSLSFYDIDIYKKHLIKLKSYQKNLKDLTPINYKPLRVPSILKYKDIIQPIEYRPIKPIWFIQPFGKYSPIKKEIEDLYSISKGICPVCNSLLLDVEVHVHDI